MNAKDTAVVIGSGPNGLSAAIVLARAGLTVQVFEANEQLGGGTRTAELTVPGVLHDVCSAVHPFGIASPFFRTLPLEEHGLTWCFPEVDLAHALDGGTAAVLQRSIEHTADGLGSDGPAWRRAFGAHAKDFNKVAEDFFGPLVRVPRHPVSYARFGLHALPSATFFARRFTTREARALFAGAAAHTIQPLTQLGTAAAGVSLIAAGHDLGWPVARGGSHSITKALASYLASLGGTIHTGTEVRTMNDVPEAAVVMFDTNPGAAARILGDALPSRSRDAYQKWKFGPAAYKLDLAIEGGIPWTAEACRSAGTVHLGGTFEEIAASEAAVASGTMPERPFALVGQQYLADPSRSNGNVHPIWVYAHVPNGYTGDASEAILKQIERFAPGARERIVGMHSTTPTAFEQYNPNFVGGDIATGANTFRQLVVRPRLSVHPYATGIPGVFLCSAATPPGAGVHGMGGYHAATAALAARRRV